MSFLLALPLGYWTITGSKFIGTKTSAASADALLLKIAVERGLKTKVSRFEIIWQEDFFQVSPIEGGGRLV